MDDSPKSKDFELGESFAAALTETTQSLVCVYDREARILLFNDACERATGYSREEVLGRDARDFVIPPEERDAFGEFLAYVWKTGSPSPQVGHWRTKAGGRLLVAWSNKPLSGPDGAPSTLVTTGIDLTDRAPRFDDGDRALQGDPEAKLIEVSRLAAEQRALRRVATLVAAESSPERVFTAVSEECARVLQVNSSAVFRYEGHETATIVGRVNRDGVEVMPVGGRLAAGESSAVGRVLRTGASGADRRLGRREGRRRHRRRDLPRRLSLVGGGADRRGRRAVGRRGDRERGAAAARRRAPAGGVLRAGVAGGGERAGAGRPDRVAGAAGLRRRRAAAPAGAQPARRRAAASRVGGGEAAGGADAVGGAPGRGGEAGRGVAARTRRRARGAARDRARPPSRDPHRAGAVARARRAGGPAAGDGRDRSAR